MALWQYTFQILPKKSFSTLRRDDENTLFDDEPYWKYEPINKNYFEGVGQLLIKGKSWSKEIDLFGNEKSNCLEILFDTPTYNIKSVSLRIDFTSEYELVLRGIIDFCIYKELIILDEELQTIPLNYESISCIINNSPQFKRYNELQEQSPE
ncbi:MAG: hypothetical protein IPN86_04775 [Saprospiraceae bacterium]|nr:hypothetical protein [Saprospiraceae bacterium]